MTYQPIKSSCLLVPSGPATDGKHLHVIVTNRCSNNCHLVTSIQTVYPGEYSDPACVLQAGAHPFVTHLSWVAYHRCGIWDHNKIIDQVDNFAYLIKPLASSVMVESIIEGFAVSRRATPIIKRYLAANCML